MLLQRANSSPQILSPPSGARRSMSISPSSTSPISSSPITSPKSSTSPNNVENTSSKRRSMSIAPLLLELQKSKLGNNSRPQTPTSPSSPRPQSPSLNSPKQGTSVKSNVVSDKKGSLHMDLDKLDEWLQPDEVLRPTLSILSPKPSKPEASPTSSPRGRSNSLSRFDSSNLERMCTSPTFSPKNASPINRVLQQEGAATTPKIGRNRSMSNFSACSAFSDLSYRSSLSNLSIQYLEPEDDDVFEPEEEEEEIQLDTSSPSNTVAEEPKISSSESSESEDEEEVIQSAKTFDELFHKKFSKLPSSNKPSPLESLLSTTIDEEASTNFAAFSEMLKAKLAEGKKASQKNEQKILKKKGVKSLSWLKSLIDKLYTYSHDLFITKGNNIQQQLYTTPMIIYSIMKTKFVYSTVTNINWHDMLKSAKAYRKYDFEVETFFKFMSGEYTLETFIWFVCSRSVANKAVEELEIKKTEDSMLSSESENSVIETAPPSITPSRSVVSDILEKKRRKLQALERKEENRHNLEKSKSFITMQNAIHAICNLVSKKLIQGLPFLGSNSVNDKSIDPYTLKHNVENVLIRKFGLIRSKELRNEEAISLPQFLGYIVSIKATKLHLVFHELKKYLVDEDHGMLEKFSDSDSPLVVTPVLKRSDSGINISSVLEKLTDIAHRVEDGESIDSPREPRTGRKEVVSESIPETQISPIRTPPSLEKSLSNLNLSVESTNFINNYKNNLPIIEPVEEEKPEEIFKLPKEEEDLEASLSNEVVAMINVLSELIEDMPRTEDGVSAISEVYVQHVEHILKCLPTLGKVQEQYASVLLEDMLFNTREVLNNLPFFSNYSAGIVFKIDQWLAQESTKIQAPQEIYQPKPIQTELPPEEPLEKFEQPIIRNKDFRQTFDEQITMNKLKDVIDDEDIASELMDLLSEVKNL